MTLRAATRYARSEGGYVAWQAFGDAPRDILFVSSWATNIDAMWDEPSCALFFERLSRIGRVICFDKRGTGVSDPVPLAALPTLEEWMDDAVLALDAAGSRRVAVVGDTEGGVMAMLLAATFPDRVSALVLVNAFARWRRAPDYPIGMPVHTFERLLELYEQHWGQDPAMLEITAPDVASDPHMREWFMRIQRLAMPPGAATRMYRWVLNVDVRSILPAIAVPTLVIHRRDNRHYRAEFGRHLAGHISGARPKELPGADCYPFHTPASGQVLDAIQEFLTGEPATMPAERELATVLFTDIVNSTGFAAEIGDAHWLQIRAAHDANVRQNLASHRGREIERTGDGFLATFDGGPRGLYAAQSGSATSCEVRWASTSAPASTPAKSSDARRKSAGWPCISPRACLPSPNPARCWSQARSRISSSGRESSSRSVGATRSRVSPARGDCCASRQQSNPGPVREIASARPS